MVNPRIALIAALDTEGQVFYSLSHANTDSDVMMTFFLHMTSKLDQESPGWQDNTMWLLDNASWHRSLAMKDAIKRQGLKVMFTAPYSFQGAPIELLFSGLKFGELNKGGVGTGKR